MKVKSLLGQLQLTALAAAFSFGGGVASLAAPSIAMAQASPGALQNASADVVQTGLQVGPATNAPDAQGRYLVIVRFHEPSLASYRGGVGGLEATSPRVTGASRLDATSPASEAYLEYLGERQAEHLETLGATIGRSLSPQFQYLNVLNAVAVRLTLDEANKIAQEPVVRTVALDEVRSPSTDAGPAWIGAPAFWDGDSVSGQPNKGEGVVVGIIDSGLNQDHPSFAATASDGYVHLNPTGTSGTFLGDCGVGGIVCNDKLYGAYDFHPSSLSAEDTDGHGSHVASTAAGNPVSTTYNGIAVNISGVAPRANLINYKVCSPTCPQTSSVAAVNQAITDGADVLNYSISGSDSPWNDSVDLAFLDATEAGIFVTTSAGNSGPNPSTLAHSGPWNATVGNSSHNRVIGPGVNAAGINGLISIEGSGPAITADLTRSLVDGASIGGNGRGCTAGGGYAAGTLTNRIVLIERGDCNFAEKVANAQGAGAAGVLMYNNAGGPAIAMGGLEASTIPAVMIDRVDGQAVKAAIVPASTATLSATNIRGLRDSWGDVLSTDSSRGPSQNDVLKPDYAAPGTNILAAFHNGVEFEIISGTSMASPHATGAAALVRAEHPSWTPAQVKSAIALTAKPDMLKQDGNTPADPFDRGSGRVDITQAALAGAVMDETAANFEAANPGAGGDPRTLNVPNIVDSECAETCTFTRTITSVAPEAVAYNATATAPAGVTVTVTPATFNLAAGGEQELTIEVTADTAVAPVGSWAFASVALTPEQGGSLELLNESFTSATFPPTGWTRYEELGNGATAWARTTTATDLNSAPGGARRVFGGSTEGNQIDWLVSPPIALGEDGQISFFERVQWPEDYGKHSILVSTDSCAPADGDFVELVDVGAGSNNLWRQVSYPLTGYENETVCIAFKYEGDFASVWMVDDISVTESVAAAGVEYATLRMPVAIMPQLADPAIDVTPTSVSATADQGETVTQAVSIANVGGAVLEWDVLASAPRGPVVLSAARAAELETAPLPADWFESATFASNKGRVAELAGVTPTPAPEGAGGIVLSQSTSMIPSALTNVACSPDGGTTTSDNKFLRAFPLNSFGITDAFTADEVTIAIESLSVSAPITVNLYSLNGAFTYANMTQIGTATQTLAPQNLTNVTIPVTGTVPANGTLVVEVVPPNLAGTGAFFYGSNSAGQSAPSYISAAACNILNPTTYASINFPNVHLAMSVTSNEELDCGVNGSATWATATPDSGTVNEGATGGTTLSLDATGLAIGSHTTNLCIASNDPVDSVVVVPVTLDVEGAAVISLSQDSIDEVLESGASTTVDLGISNLGGLPLTWEASTNGGVAPRGSNVLFENGPFVTHPGAGVGGNDASALQQPLGLTSYGAGTNNAAGVRLADDFTVTDGQWTIDSMRFYSYQTGSTTTSTINGAFVQIWDGEPGAAGSTVVWGDTTTNRLSGTSFAGAYRTLDTDIATASTRPIMNVDVNLGGLVLEAGTYWVDWGLTGTLASGPWTPPITILGQTTTGDALQLIDGAWGPLEDGGTFTAQGVPFQVNGSAAAPECAPATTIPWLSVAPTSGTVAPGGTDTTVVTIDAATLADGAYSAEVCVESNDAASPVVSVPVNVVVGDVPVPATIAVNPTSLSANVDLDSTIDQTLTISNEGTEELTWSIVDTENAPQTAEYTYGLANGGNFVANAGFGRASGKQPEGQAQRVVHPAPQGAPVASLTENFDDVTLLAGAGWGLINNSAPQGTTSWFQGNAVSTDGPFDSHQGADNSYIGANFNSTTGGTGTISTWLLTPEVALTNGTELRFWTRNTGGQWADRLEVRLSTAGASSNVGAAGTGTGDFSTVLLTINPNLVGGPTGYPGEWTEFTATVSGLPGATTGRFGLRYFVTAAGPSGTNSDYIGIDTLSITAGGPPPASCSAPADLDWLSVAPASGTTAGESSSAVTVTYDSTGLAAGTYEGTLCVTSNDAANPLVEVPVAMTVADLEAQTITFDPLPDVPLTAGTITVSATASSGLTVSFTSDTPAVCTVSGTTVTLVSLGTCTIRASQAGDATYAAAPDVVQSFEVTENVDVVITPATVPAAQIDVPYSVTFTASGAGTTAPFAYAVSAGALPPGLTLNGTTGELSGTPTQVGSFDFTITAIDSTPAGNGGPYTASQAYTLVVRDEYIFGDGFEDDAVTKLEVGGAGTKSIDLPIVDAFADLADGKVRNIVALTVGGKRAGTVQLRCGGSGCEVRVAHRQGAAKWASTEWTAVHSDPFTLQLDVGHALVKSVAFPAK